MHSRTRVVAGSFVLVAGLFALPGCGAQAPQEGFVDVQEILANRQKRTIHWRMDGEEDHEVDRSVSEMLKHELQVEDAVQIALFRNRNLQAVYEDLGMAQADLVRAGLLRNPVFNAEARFSSGSGFTLDFSLVQNFLDVLFLPTRERLSETAYQRAKLHVAASVLEVAHQVGSQYYHLQSTLQKKELRQKILQATDASYDLAKRMREAGNITLLDLDLERAVYEEARLDFAEVENEERREREQLNTRMGLWGLDTGWKLPTLLPEIPATPAPFNGLEKMAVASSLNLEMRRLDIQYAAEKLGVARPMELLEGSGIGASAEASDDAKTEIGPAISVPLPIFDFGQSAQAQAQSELRRSYALYEAEAVEVRSRARSFRDHLLATQERVEFLLKVVIPLRQRILVETQKEYNAMLIGAFQLIQAKKDEIQAGELYIEALNDYWQARTDFDLLMQGVILP